MTTDNELATLAARIAETAARDAVDRLTGAPKIRFDRPAPAPPVPTPAAQNAGPVPDPAGFAAAVRRYDAVHPLRHAAVRSVAVDRAWLAGQLARRRAFLLSVARSFGLGTAALEAMADPLDAELTEIERIVEPELIAALAL